MAVAQVPFIDLSRYEPGFLEQMMAGVQVLLKNTQFVGGPQISKLEQTLAERCKVGHAMGCANGTDAIQLALRAAGVGAGDIVLIPDMTFWATFEAVVNVGARPVTLDVNSQTLHLDHSTFCAGIERFKPKAAILVHLYGWAAPETNLIRKTAHAQGVVLVEDCAQAFDTLLDGKPVISGAQISTTSFYPAKVLGASGDAGAVFTANDAWAASVKQLLDHGRLDHYRHGSIGWNSRIGSYEALFLNESLNHLTDRLNSRRRICLKYREKLSGLPIKFLEPASGVSENGYLSVALVEPSVRESLIMYLKDNKIGYRTVYPGAMSRQPGAAGYLAGKIDEGKADLIARSVLNLPCFAYMTDEELDYVVKKVRGFFS